MKVAIAIVVETEISVPFRLKELLIVEQEVNQIAEKTIADSIFRSVRTDWSYSRESLSVWEALQTSLRPVK